MARVLTTTRATLCDYTGKPKQRFCDPTVPRSIQLEENAAMFTHGTRRDFADGTVLFYGRPYGYCRGGRALCEDGKVRAIAYLGTPDTWFSTPAGVRIRGKYVRGFITVETRDGFSTATKDDPAVVKFIAYKTKN